MITNIAVDDRGFENGKNLAATHFESVSQHFYSFLMPLLLIG